MIYFLIWKKIQRIKTHCFVFAFNTKQAAEPQSTKDRPPPRLHKQLPPLDYPGAFFFKNKSSPLRYDTFRRRRSPKGSSSSSRTQCRYGGFVVFLEYGPGIPQIQPDPLSSFPFLHQLRYLSLCCLLGVILLVLVTGTRNYDILVPVTLLTFLSFF